jgi:hypothetical protein
MYVRATVQCHECNKVRALYCKQPLRKLEKLHAGCRAVVLNLAGSDSDGNACNNADAADSNGSDGMGRGSAVAEENLAQRGAVVDGDADGAAAGSSGNATESTQPQAQSAGAHSTHATDSDLSQSASEPDVMQDDANLDAQAESGSDAIAETDTSADEVQMQMHKWAGADAPAHADADADAGSSCGRTCCPANRRR